MAGGTALVFQMGRTAQIEQTNLAALDTYVLSMGGQWVLDKVQGLNSHGGGQQITSGTEPYTILVNYLAELTGDDFGAALAQQPAYSLEPAAATYRRASLLLTGTIPSAAKLASLANPSRDVLRSEIRNLMQGAGFHEFLKRGANDQLLIRSLKTTRILANDFNDYYPVFNENYNKNAALDHTYAAAVMNEVAEAPLELIAYVVEHNRPYTEVLTANYTMVSSKTASVYKTGLAPAAGEFVSAVNQGQHISGNFRSYPRWDWNSSRPVHLAHAGILTEPAFLQQYPATATNRNRARARWTYMHFLGFDIEASAARTISATALQDMDNPTLNNEACTACHQTLDPVAGAFQNFNERGIYRSGPYGLDSLDALYKYTSLYKKGDTWYTDMLAPGFGDHAIDEQEASLRQLAQHIVADPRFASAAVKFWWPAIFGETFFSPGLTRAQFEAKSQTLARLSENFAQSNHNLRELLAAMMMSDWFRAANLTDTALTAADTAIYTGGKRLLTPEELAAKTASLTGVNDVKLAGGMSTLYGGMDSVGIDHRQRDLSHMMSRAAERHALSSACTIVATEFNKPRATRKLFNLVEREDLPGSGNDLDTQKIRHQISQLIERMHGQVLLQDSLKVLNYTQLFIDLRANNLRRSAPLNLVENNIRCDYDSGGVARSVWGADPKQTLTAWRGVIAALMTDFAYLYE